MIINRININNTFLKILFYENMDLYVYINLKIFIFKKLFIKVIQFI